MAERSATVLEVTRDIVIALLTDNKSLTIGMPDKVADNVVQVFNTVFEAVRAKNNS